MRVPAVRPRLSLLGVLGAFMGFLALLVAGCGSGTSGGAIGGGSASGGPNRPPYTVHMQWGTFHLAKRIADKIKAHQPINYVFSYQGTGIPLFSPQYAAGYNLGCKQGNKIYPLHCSSLAPTETNASQQIQQIQSAVAAGQVDCISIEPTTTQAFTPLDNQLIAQGIPVFTVGITTFGHELTNFTQDPKKEGTLAADTLLRWMKATGHRLTVFAVSGGDPTQYWAINRMKYFQLTIQHVIPTARFLTTWSSPLDVTYDPGTIKDKASAFIAANPNVQFILNADIGAEYIDSAITAAHRAGKIFTIGWNDTPGQLAAIKDGVQVAALDQRWPQQAEFGGPACATFLKTGKILPNTQTELALTRQNLSVGYGELARYLGKGS
jgi:ABC-type sugar transport system substrate-binding protein